jgi:hypothetical protein
MKLIVIFFSIVLIASANPQIIALNAIKAPVHTIEMQTHLNALAEPKNIFNNLPNRINLMLDFLAKLRSDDKANSELLFFENKLKDAKARLSGQSILKSTKGNDALLPSLEVMAFLKSFKVKPYTVDFPGKVKRCAAIKNDSARLKFLNDMIDITKIQINTIPEQKAEQDKLKNFLSQLEKAKKL